MCLKFFSWNVGVSGVNVPMIRKICAKNPFPIKHVLTTWNTAYMPLSIKSTSMNNKNWYRAIMESGYFLLRQKVACQADQIQLIPAVWHVSQPNSTPLLMPNLECIEPSIHLLFGQIFWANYNNSLTWIVGPNMGMISRNLTMISRVSS